MVCERKKEGGRGRRGWRGVLIWIAKGGRARATMQIRGGGDGRAGEAPGYRYKPEEACKEVALSQVGAGDLTRKLLNYWCQARPVGA